MLLMPEQNKSLVEFCQNNYLDISKFLDGFVKIAIWISLNCYMDLSKWIHGFVKIDTLIALCSYKDLLKFLCVFFKVVLCISCQLSNKIKLKFDHNFNACLSFCFELKVLNESKYSMPWVCCAFGNV